MDSLITKNVDKKDINIQGNDNLGIMGDNNVVFMYNGVQYNISLFYNELIRRIVEAYYLDLIQIHFVSTFIILTAILIIVCCFK